MSVRAERLARKIRAFNEEVIALVGSCPDESWSGWTKAEDWSVGVVARHIAAGHYGAAALARKIVAGEELPRLTAAQIVDAANLHAREHAGCTREEVLGLLRTEGSKLAELIASWSDEDLDRSARMDLLGGDVSAEKFVEVVVLESGREHFDSMRGTLGN